MDAGLRRQRERPCPKPASVPRIVRVFVPRPQPDDLAVRKVILRFLWLSPLSIAGPVKVNRDLHVGMQAFVDWAGQSCFLESAFFGMCRRERNRDIDG